MIGLLESPLRIGQPFNIPLNMQDKYGHETKAGTAVDVEPELSARYGLKNGGYRCSNNVLELIWLATACNMSLTINSFGYVSPLPSLHMVDGEIRVSAYHKCVRCSPI